jgi:Zn finger protein HypA/HybF involved in hydrogenase expression
MSKSLYRLHKSHVRRTLRASSTLSCRDCGASLERQTHLKVNLCPDCLSRIAAPVLPHGHHS